MIEFGRLLAANFGPFAVLELDLKQRGLVHVHGNNKDTTAADDNGSGKTHVFKAISWCLFGETPDGDKTDKLTRNGEDELAVRLAWADEDGDWEVYRTKPRVGSAQLTFEHSGQDVSAPTIAATQLEINKRLGLDFATFRNTVLYAQGDLVRFADPGTTDAERKLILKRILRLDILDKAVETAKQRTRALDKERDELSAEARSVVAELNGLSSADELKTQLASTMKDQKEQEAKAANLPKLRELDGQLQEAVDDAKSRLSERDQHIAVQQEQKLIATKKQAEAVAARERITELEEALAMFHLDNKCPTCNTSTTAVSVKKHIAVMEHNLLAQEQAEAALMAEFTTATERAAEAIEAALVIKREVDAEIMKWAPKQMEIKREITIAEQAALSAARLRRTAEGFRGQLKAIDAKRKLLQARGLEITARLEEIQNETNHLSFWVKGLSNSGLSSYMMDAIMPELTKRANHYLEILSDGDITIAFDTQSKLKSGESREKLTINWTIEGEENTTPSGGQRKKISIAVDLALMDIVAQRERSAIDLLLMDEMLDGLDASGRARVMTLLAELRQKRSTIIVISHDSAITELFEHSMVVVKEDRVASLVEEA